MVRHLTLTVILSPSTKLKVSHPTLGGKPSVKPIKVFVPTGGTTWPPILTSPLPVPIVVVKLLFQSHVGCAADEAGVFVIRWYYFKHDTIIHALGSRSGLIVILVPSYQQIC